MSAPVTNAPPPAGTAHASAHASPLAALRKGLDRCVHCGFCLPACPTYVTLHDENDSPRGRLVLMQRLLDGELDVRDPDLGTHIDRCLGCRACEPACPSGVPYGELLEATRATMRPARPLPRIGRAILAVFASPRALSFAMQLARLARASRVPRFVARRFGRMLPRRLAFPLAMLASSAPASRTARASRSDSDSRPPHANGGSAATPAGGRATDVLLFDGCVMPGLFGHVQQSATRALHTHGHRVTRVAENRCCGALHAHAGDLDGARRLARIVIAELERNPRGERGAANEPANEQTNDRTTDRTNGTPIACTSAGCGAMLESYAHLFADDPEWAARASAVAARACDISELLAASPTSGANGAEGAAGANGVSIAPATGAGGSGAPARVTYSPPCHLLHAQRVSGPPESLLDALPSCTRVPLADAGMCCGSAGIYNLLEPETSDTVLDAKLATIRESGARVVATGNPGCLMQIGAGLLLAGDDARAAHPVELLGDA